FLYFEPSQRVTTKPVVDILQEASRAAAAIELPAPRPEVAEAKSAPPPAPAVAPALPPGGAARHCCRRPAVAAPVKGRDQGAAGQAQRGRFHRRADRRGRRAADKGRGPP